MTNTVFIGNPGTGKSSTMNCYLGEVLFKSGFSKTGSGVTFQLDIQRSGDNTWMDTPGLSDTMLREEAARAINEALQQGGAFRLVFVLTLEEGRVRADDITTIKMVLEACNGRCEQVGIDQFALLINKTSKEWLDQMSKEELGVWCKSVNSFFTKKKMPTTKYINFAPEVTELKAANNKLVALDASTRAFIDHLPTINIDKEQLEEVNADDFDALREAMDEMERQLAEAQKEAKEKAVQMEVERKAKLEAEAARLRIARELQQKEEENRISKRKGEEAAAYARREQQRLENQLAAQKKIIAKLEGKGSSGGLQLWGDSADHVVLVNNTKVTVAYETSFHKTSLGPGASSSHDWAWNAVFPWCTPDVTVHWSAATDTPQSGEMLLQAGQALVLTQ